MAERIIKTKRLVLRPLDMTDVPDMTRLIGDLEVSRWLTVVPHPYGLADARQFIGHIAGDWDYAIEIDGAFAGVIGAGGGLGFWLGRSYWGNGYMGEAAHGIVGAWFADENRTLRSGYFVENLASAAIHDRLGFAKGAVVQQRSRAQGCDMALQRVEMHRADWQARRG